MLTPEQIKELGLKRKGPVRRRKILADQLRSGNFERMDGELRRDDRFCALGVACHLYDPSKWVIEEWGTAYYMGRGCFPPGEVLMFFGMTEKDEAAITKISDTRGLMHAAEYIEGM